MVADFERLILPGMSHWNHPGWFAYFAANSSPPSVLAEMLTATLGAQCMSWQTSPAATELEQVTMGWLSRMLDLPPGFTGVIQDTASTATLVALLSARERASDFAGERLGIDSRQGTPGICLGGGPLVDRERREVGGVRCRCASADSGRRSLRASTRCPGGRDGA